MPVARSIHSPRNAWICACRADADVFAHPERLEAVDVGATARAGSSRRRRRTCSPAAGTAPRSAAMRIDRVAGGRRQHEIGGLQRVGPGLAALCEALHDAADVPLVAAKAADCAQQVREALQVAVPLQLGAAHHRRKAQHLGAGRPIGRDQRRQRFDHALVETGAGVNSVHAGLQKERAFSAGPLVPAPDELGLNCPWTQPLMAAGTSASSAEAATLARMRSLLIMIGEESTSRRWRPIETSLSLR